MKRLLISSSLAIVALTTGCRQQRYCCDSYDIVKETYVHRYGVEVAVDDWDSSGQDGKVISTLVSGVTVTKNYANGVLEGETTYSFPHDQTIERADVYENGVLVKQIVNYRSGVPMSETRILSPSTKETKWWYENSTPKAIEGYENNVLTRGEYYNYQNKLDSQVTNGQGKRISRDAYGLLISTDQIKDGQMVSRMTYYPNGAPKEIIPYANNVVQGQKKSFLPGGEPASVEEWSAGQQHGMTTLFQNGEKIAEVSYSSGVKSGVEKRFRDGETVVEEISWRNDLKDGPSYSYVEGQVISNWFYKGNPVSKTNYEKLTGAK